MVTGANSMLGRAIINELREYTHDIWPVYHDKCDLAVLREVNLLFENVRPEIVIHCAGFNGNIEFNKKYPEDIFYQTTQMALNVLKMSKMWAVEKVVSLISSCAYPDLGQLELKETEFWMGEPNPSVDAHGFAKRVILEYGRQLWKNGDLLSIGMVVNTAYGPWDSFSVHKTKVIGGLIRKFSDARKNKLKEVECWGTGNPRREFIYCSDVAKHLIQVLYKYDDANYPINIGSGIDYKISEVAEIIADVIGFNGNIIWNNTYPDGQMRKLLDNSKMKMIFGDLKFTDLKIGLERTISWYENKHNYTKYSTT